LKPPDPISLPPYAYVPGINGRHDPEIFAPFHASVCGAMGPEELARSIAWRAGWVFVQNGYYWEAHEVLEAVWSVLPPGSDERLFVQAIIQAANAALKLEMQRPKATLKLCGIALELLTSVRGRAAVMDRPVDDVKTFLTTVRQRAESAA